MKLGSGWCTWPLRQQLHLPLLHSCPCRRQQNRWGLLLQVSISWESVCVCVFFGGGGIGGPKGTGEGGGLLSARCVAQMSCACRFALSRAPHKSHFKLPPRATAIQVLCACAVCVGYLRVLLQRDAVALEQHLSTVTAGLVSMQQLLDRMGEHCDPYIYYQRVRVPM